MKNSFVKIFFLKSFLALFFFFGFFLNNSFAQSAGTTSVTVSVLPSTQTVNSGQKTSFKITSSGATDCYITGGGYNNFKIILNGNINISPTVSATYTFSCKNSSETKTATASITVNGSIPATGGAGGTNSGGTNTGGGSGSGSGSGSGGGNSTQQTRGNQSSPYSTQTVQDSANQLCAKYSGYQKTFNTPGVIGGGGTVPTSLPTVEQLLVAIQNYTALTGDELREANLLKYCTEYLNMAQASVKLAENTAKELKTLADNCYADESCMRTRTFKNDLEKEIDDAGNYPLYGREIQKLILTLNEPKPSTLDKLSVKAPLIKACEDYYGQGFVPIDCLLVPTAFDVQTTAYDYVKNKIDLRQNEIGLEFLKGNGVMGSRPCVKTTDGSDPKDVPWYDSRKCAEYKVQPSLINQEVLKQITALPFTQAYSPASVLGSDGVINNINTRVREGNLIDPDISTNFGSIQGGGTNPITGVGGGTPVNGTDLASVEPNYNMLVRNLDAIIKLYDVGRLAYASSTSVCKRLPVSTRSQVVAKIDASKKTYTDYKTDLQKKWTDAKAKPRENHNSLVVQINFDLRDKFNQKALDDVKNAIMTLLQSCVNASS
jgi:hypothetical protein